MTAHEAAGHTSQLRFSRRQFVASFPDVDTTVTSGCSTCDDTGTIHAFWAYLANEPEIGFPPGSNAWTMVHLRGQPGALDIRDAGVTGRPLAAAADAGTVYLLYSDAGGVYLAGLSADGTLGPGSLLSSELAIQGTLVADEGGWWAAWIEDRDNKLYEAYGGWGNGDFPREPVTSELSNVLYYGSPSLALGPRNPAEPGSRRIYLGWEMALEPDANVVRLASQAVQAAGWLERAWLPAPSTHGFVSCPALAYDGALQAAFDDVPGVDFMRNPSHTTSAHRLTTAEGGAPMIAASAGQTVVAWTVDGETAGDLWVAEPAGPAVRLATQTSFLSAFGLTSHAGRATLFTFEDGDSLYVRTQTA